VTSETYRDPGASVDERVADLLSRMTLDEKVAQLGAIWAAQLVTDDAFDEATAQHLLANGIGQVTRIGASTGLLAEESASFINQIQRVAVEHTRLGIPVLLHEEAVGGLTHRGATTFPQALGLASTWDPSLVGQVAEVIRSQMLAVGARLALAPVLDVARDPRWGRVEETYGESPELCARLGVAYVRGLQSSDLSNGVACAAKHFLAYAVPIGGRNQAPVHVGARELRDVYATPFAVAIRDAELAGIMNSYSSVDGLPCAGSREILTDLLRGELAFRGTVVADYFAVNQLLENHRTAADRRAAAAQAITAGLDVELPSLDYFKELPVLVRAGHLAEETIDVAVERVLAQKFRLGLFDRPYVEPSRAAACFDTPEQRDLARRVAAKAVCLLTNDGVLPLQPSDLGSVAVIGPHADDARLLQGDYHYPAHLEIMDPRAWEGTAAPEGLPTEITMGGPGHMHPERSTGGGSFRPGPHFTTHVTPLAALRTALGPQVTVDSVRGCHDSNAADEDRRSGEAGDGGRRRDRVRRREIRAGPRLHQW
jgi:beta-glucosidase